MVLYVIGLGLSDEKDITLKGLEAVKPSEKVYLEAYTSILMVADYQKRLEALYGKPIQLAHREVVELQSEEILSLASTSNVSFLVVGDPLSATTHTDLILRARKSNPPIKVQVIHNASISTAIGSSGLQGYNFGQTVSVPFWTENWKPDSWLERILENNKIGNHTLLLGDIKVREQSEKDMARGIERYQPPRYMLIPQLISQLLTASSNFASSTSSSISELLPHNLSSSTLAVALCRMGSEDEFILSGTLGELLQYGTTLGPNETLEDEEEVDEDLLSEIEIDALRNKRNEKIALKKFGGALHSLVIVGKRLHHLEREYAGMYMVEGSEWNRISREVYGCED